MKNWYSAFVYSYFRWYNRLSTSAHHPGYAPSLFLSALQTLNIFSLSLLLLPREALDIGRWPFALTFLAIFMLFNWPNARILGSIAEAPTFSKLSDNVPGIREFPQVYGYLALTLGLLFLPVLTI